MLKYRSMFFTSCSCVDFCYFYYTISPEQLQLHFYLKYNSPGTGNSKKLNCKQKYTWNAEHSNSIIHHRQSIQNALPFSVLLRKLPLHIRRHRLSRYFPDLSDPKRLNFAAVQECVQCIFSNAEKLHDLLKLHDLIFHVTGRLSAFSRIFLLFFSLC